MIRSTRLRLVLALGAAAVVLAGAAATALVLRGERSEAYRGSPPPPGIELPDFALPDQDGTIVSSRSLRGRVIVLTFLDTQCTESCPIIAAVIGRALGRLTAEERAQVAALAISTDPAEDTPTSVREFLERHRAEGRLRYLVAPEASLRPLWNALQIAVSLDTGDDSLHSAPVRIYDRAGEWVSTQHAGADLSTENLAADIRSTLGQ